MPFDDLNGKSPFSAGASHALELDEPERGRVLDTSSKGVFVVARAVARTMKSSGSSIEVDGGHLVSPL